MRGRLYNALVRRRMSAAATASYIVAVVGILESNFKSVRYFRTLLLRCRYCHNYHLYYSCSNGRQERSYQKQSTSNRENGTGIHCTKVYQSACPTFPSPPPTPPYSIPHHITCITYHNYSNAQSKKPEKGNGDAKEDFSSV